MASPLAQSDSTFEQQATNLVDDCGATHHPTLPYSMQGLQIQLVIALDRYEAHLWPLDCLRNRLGVNVVALVGLYVRLQHPARPPPPPHPPALTAPAIKCEPRRKLPYQFA